MFGESTTWTSEPALDGFTCFPRSLILCTVAICVVSLALPIMTLQIYDRILPNPGSGTLYVLIAGVLLAVVLEGVLRLCRAFVMGRAAAAHQHRMTCRAIRGVLFDERFEIDRMGTSGFLSRVEAIGKLKEFHAGYALTVLVELSFLPLFFLVLAYISKSLALVPAVVVLLFLVLSIWKGERLKGFLGERENADGDRHDFLIETLEGVHTLKSAALEQPFARKYEALEAQSTLANYLVTKELGQTFNFSAVFSQLMVASVITVGALLTLQGSITTGALVAALLLSGRMLQPIQKALSLSTRYQEYRLAREKVRDLGCAAIESVDHQAASADSPPRGHVRLKGVTLHREAADTGDHSGIDIEIPSGEAILISGKNGSGKSELLKAIAGTAKLKQGAIEVDGTRINERPPRMRPYYVGYVETQPLIFRGTIRDNITSFGQTEEIRAQEVASLLEVDREVAKLPNGFDTFLTGDGTDNISTGLKQRISIVRALAAKPKLILFDNADRALDRAGYNAIYNLLARIKGKATLLLVSDDHNIRALADRQFELEDGTLKEVARDTSAGQLRSYRELHL